MVLRKCSTSWTPNDGQLLLLRIQAINCYQMKKTKRKQRTFTAESSNILISVTAKSYKTKIHVCDKWGSRRGGERMASVLLVNVNKLIVKSKSPNTFRCTFTHLRCYIFIVISSNGMTCYKRKKALLLSVDEKGEWEWMKITSK